jgi:predicted nucleic acid-binding protein
MSAKYFLDTNTLLYCFDPMDSRKQRIATILVDNAVNEALGAISYQVCQEFCNVMLHKLRDTFPLAVFDAYLATHVFPLIQVQPSPQLFREAIRIHRQTQYRFYDSLIVAAALESGAFILYSEDLQHDRQIAHLRIVNPFI